MEGQLRNKLFFSFKTVLTVFLSGLTFNVYAEYYVVYPGTAVSYPPINCNKVSRRDHCGRCRGDTCCYPISSAYNAFTTYESYQAYAPIESIYSSAPRRRAVHVGSGEVGEYAWIPTPEYPDFRAPVRKGCISRNP